MPHALSSNLTDVLAACDANRARDLADLERLLRQPSISAQDVGIAECAALVQAMLGEAGFATRQLPTRRHPMIYGEWLGAPGKPTLLIYGHYDVQPPEPLDAWGSPPFAPTIRDGKLYARGAGDNKGQFWAQICGLRAWLETAGRLPVNVKLLLEGEEETGSPHLAETVAAHRELLACDLVFTADGPALADDLATVEYGVRGLVSVELRAHGANQDLHSGNWGGVAPNPAWTLVQLLATMVAPNGEVTIPGFHDGVRPLSAAAQAAVARLPFDPGAALASIGVATLPPPVGVPFFDRIMARPTANIAGFHAGYGGPGSKTVIPAEAVVKMDFRLVPDQDPDAVFAAIAAHVARHAPDVEIQRLGAMRPSATPLDHPFAAAVRRAVATGFGRQPFDVPLRGGSLPDAVWTRDLGIPSFIVPYADADEHNHAPNERISLDRFWAGIRTTTALVAELGEASDVR